jgi:hypothetical protein
LQNPKILRGGAEGLKVLARIVSQKQEGGLESTGCRFFAPKVLLKEKNKGRAIPAAALCALLARTVNLCNLRNMLHFPLGGHVFPKPYVGPPPSNERRSGDHCKRNG